MVKIVELEENLEFASNVQLRFKNKKEGFLESLRNTLFGEED